MGLFGFGKKKEKKETACCCGTEATNDCCCGTETTHDCCCGSDCHCDCTPKEEVTSSCCGKPVNGICCIKVLGAGCKACHEQYEYAKTAVKALGLAVEVEYITDMEKVMDYGVMAMPAIVVNEKVVSAGKVLKAADVEKLLKK